MRELQSLVRESTTLLRRALLVTDLLTLLGLAIACASVVYFLSTFPIAFQKSMAIQPTPAREPDWTSGPALDVAPFVRGIPYRGSEMVNLVRPSQIYAACIERGRGNCANKSRGLSWYLTNKGIPFQRVDLLPIDGFLAGKGHTVVRTRYELEGEIRVGIVDMLEGALPTHRGEPVDLPEFRLAAPFSFGLLKLSPRVDDASDYYGTFLESVVIGTVEGEQISRYLRYLERWHVDLGFPSYERLVYAATAIVLGIFPKTHVTPEQYDQMYQTAPWTFRFAYTLTWTVRILLFILPLTVALHAVDWWLRRNASRSAAVAQPTSPVAS